MRIRPRWIVLSGVLLGALALFLVSSPDSERMTKEELVRAASGTTAEASYEYYFSEEELHGLTKMVKPYDCSSSGSLNDYDQYLCGVTDYFIRDEGNFVPEGYMFHAALGDRPGGPVIGIRILRAASP